MPICKGCKQDADELQPIEVDGKSKNLCEECADEALQADALGEAAQSAMQGMMEYKGRR